MTVVRINESRALYSAGWTDRRLRNEPVMISQMARAAADWDRRLYTIRQLAESAHREQPQRERPADQG